MIELLKLAKRCEAAAGQDREMDADIYVKTGEALDPMTLGGTIGSWVPRFTLSIDDARTLVPKGWEVALYWGVEGFQPEAQLETGAGRESLVSEPISGRAPTIALALCAAALRAMVHGREFGK